MLVSWCQKSGGTCFCDCGNGYGCRNNFGRQAAPGNGRHNSTATARRRQGTLLMYAGSGQRHHGNSPAGKKANLWHRRLAHVNARSLDVLRKADGNGATYDREVSACDVYCHLEEHATSSPENCGTQRQFPVPTGPHRYHGAHYLGKFTDQHSKWKEIYLMLKASPTLSPRLFCFSPRSYSREDTVFDAFERIKAENTPETTIWHIVSRRVFGTSSPPPTPQKNRERWQDFGGNGAVYYRRF